MGGMLDGVGHEGISDGYCRFDCVLEGILLCSMAMKAWHSRLPVLEMLCKYQVDVASRSCQFSYLKSPAYLIPHQSMPQVLRLNH